MLLSKSIFQTLSEVDITPYIKEKNKLSYLPWSSAWEIIKLRYPQSTFYPVKSETGCIYHTDGKSCWVETSLTISDGEISETQNETLAVMDYRNQSISFDDIQSTKAGNSIKRCLVKNAALFGLGLSLWVGEELSDSAKKIINEKLKNLKAEIVKIAKVKIEEEGIEKNKVYSIVADNNGGNKNPNSIKSTDVAQIILDKINELKK